MSVLYYYLGDDGQTVVGPFDLPGMWELREAGTLVLGTLICPEGSEDWQPLASYPELRIKPAPPPAGVHLPAPTTNRRAVGVSPQTAGCAVLGGLVLCILIYACATVARHASSSGSSSATTAVESNADREADALSGYKEGRRLGNNRYRERSPRPTTDDLDKVLATVDANRSEAYKLGFKGGYLSAWDNDGRDL